MWLIKKSRPGLVLLCDEAGDAVRRLPETLARKLGMGGAGEYDIPDLLEQIEKEEPKRARGRAEWYLSRRDYGGAELCKKLEQAGFSSCVSGSIVEEMVERGYIDDARYAEFRVARARRAGKSGRHAVRELAFKGVNRELAAGAAENPEAEAQAADLALTQLKYRYRNRPDEDQKRLITAAMQRRGFSWDALRAAMESNSQ